MRNIKASIIVVCLLATCLLLFSIYTEAHSGGTDWRGGHKNHATGEYHYHHGYSAHDHYDIDGDGKKDCPYTFDYASMSKAESETTEESKTKKNKSFGEICGDIFVCFFFTLLSFPFILILLGFTALLPKKISAKLEDHNILVYAISFILTWLTWVILYFSSNWG